ncbi:hypothetical protein [Pseudomonas aeruginosa]|uniref:hypothetical protein n=1 Tax=Pseudomonas aeruginosa TaxID=287 RepID=UPI0010C52634|nr:hypothetical protein [Pseudomonas aeruginosa]QBN05282.1 PvdD(3) [Pseudomonas aeruginosa]
MYLQQLAEHAERDGNPPPVRVYCFGGDAVPQASYELAWESLRPGYLFNGYGPTETVVTPCCGRRVRRIRAVRLTHLSVPCWTSQGLCTGADLDLLPLGLAGELYLVEKVWRGLPGPAGADGRAFRPDPYGNGERSIAAAT